MRLTSLMTTLLGCGSGTAVLGTCLLGCGGDVAGTWSGDCTLTADDSAVELLIDMELTREGETPSGHPYYAGTLDIDEHEVSWVASLSMGDGDTAVLSAAGEDPNAAEGITAVFHLTIDGIFDGGTFEGTGEYWTEVTADGETEASRRYVGSCALDKGS